MQNSESKNSPSRLEGVGCETARGSANLHTESPKNVPKLRFKEFGGEWVNKYIKDVADIKTGDKDTQNRVEEGKYPFFVRSQTVERINTYSFDGEAILTAGDGVGVGKVFHYLNEKFDYHQRVYNIHNFKCDICGKYVFLYFANNFYKRVMKLNAKNSVDSVRLEMIAKMVLPLPTLPEQEKIADCLSTWDKVIETQKSLIEAKKLYKKGMMQKIFSQEIRFKDDDGADYPAWVEKKLGECIKHIGGISLEKYVSDDSTYKFISIGNYSKSGRYIDNGQRVLLNDKTKTKLLNKNDLVMVLNDKTSSGDIIGSTILVKKDDEYIYNQRSERIICGSLIFPLFLWHLLNFEKFRQRVFSLSQGGTQIYINFSTVKSIDFLVPTIGEQTKIANFLSTLDEDLELLESQLAELELQKKGLMQGMFV